MTVQVIHGDCLDVLRQLPDASVDAVVTDPPYGLEFMGKEWDSFKTGRGEKYAAGGSLDVEQMAGRSGKGGAGPSYVNRPAKRCAICGKQAWSGSPCKCDEPQWIMDNSPLHSFQSWCTLWTAECLRVLKPGGHLLAFGGTRTFHRLACAVEDAGFEIRDSIAWLYGSGFPKSLDVSKAIDKARNEDRAPVDAVRSWLNARRIDAGFSHDAVNKHFGHASNGGGSSSSWMTNPTSKALPTWDQWVELKRIFSFGDEMDAEVWRLNGRKGTPGDNFALREVTGSKLAGIATPGDIDRHTVGGSRAVEVAITAPATDAARTWQGWGTALKPAFEPVVVARKPLTGTVAANVLAYGTGAIHVDACRVGMSETDREAARVPMSRMEGSNNNRRASGRNGETFEPAPAGRWPANVALDEHTAAELDQQSGTLTSGAWDGKRNRSKFEDQYGEFAGRDETPRAGDSGGASRFFYVAKAPTKERPSYVTDDGRKIAHPTVKPLALMRWLVRLVTPPGGTVLEPFAGSGATVEACILEGFNVIAIEREAEYLPLIDIRVERSTPKPVEPAAPVEDLLSLIEEDGEAS